MPHELIITPSGHLALVEPSSASDTASEIAHPIVAAFAESPSRGLLHLATNDLQTRLPPALDYVRSFARTYLTRLCQTQAQETTKELPPTPPPSAAELATWILQAPPMTGLEYLRDEALVGLVDRAGHAGPRRDPASTRAARRLISARKTRSGGLSAESRCTWPRTNATRRIPSPSWRRMSADCRPRVVSSTSRSGGRCSNTPAPRTGKRCLPCSCPFSGRPSAARLIKELVDSGDVYHPLAWSPREAHRFLQDIPIFEESGLIVRVPDWWKPHHPARAIVNVRIDGKQGSRLTARFVARFLGRRRAGRRAA